MTASFRFGSTRVLPATREIWHRGAPAPLGDRAFELLTVLIERRERVVAKDELLQAVWQDRDVEESNLPVQVSALRRCLGPGVIATVHGRGYRFIAPLVAESDEPDASNAAAATLPFADAPAAPRLFGRDGLLAQLLQALRDHRLVTLTGPGGIGKTRLARAAQAPWAAARVWPRVAVDGVEEQPEDHLDIDGARWLDLCQVQDGLQLRQALATCLGLEAGAAPDTVPGGPADDDCGHYDALAARLQPTRCLLVLDNAEHLLPAVAALAGALLRGAPGLRLLVTSRAALGCASEQVLPVPSLDLQPALQLFLARAQQAAPQLQLVSADLAAAGALCGALEGLPLALELAAARLPVLGLDGLRQSLDERLHALVDERAMPRHRSLHATLAWSYQLLDAAEQAGLRALSVMVGPFGLDLALAVVGGSGPGAAHDRWAGVQLIESLVRKHLLSADPEQPLQWRLLESTRLFAMHALQRRGEEGAVRARHAQAMAELHERLDDDWCAGRGTEREIDAEAGASIANLVSALRWACGAGARPDLATRLLSAGGRALKVHGQRGSSAPWVQTALRALLPGLPARQQALLWLGLAQLPMPDAVATAVAHGALLQAAQTMNEHGDRARALLAACCAASSAQRAGDADQVAQALALADRMLVSTLPPRVRASWCWVKIHLQICFGVGTPLPDVSLSELQDDLRAAGDGGCRAALLIRILLAERLLLQSRWAEARAPLQAVCDDLAHGGWGPAAVGMAPVDALALAELGCGRTEEALALLRRALAAARWVDAWFDLAGPLAWGLAAHGRHRAAAQLRAAALAHARQHGAGGHPVVLVALDQADRVLRAACDDAALQRWHDEGEQLAAGGLRALFDGPDSRFLP